MILRISFLRARFYLPFRKLCTHSDKWFPSLSELCDKVTAEPRFIELFRKRDALEDFIKNGPPPEKRRCTPAEADAIRAKYQEAERVET